MAALQPGGSCHQLAYLYSLSPRHFQAHHESELLELTPEVRSGRVQATDLHLTSHRSMMLPRVALAGAFIARLCSRWLLPCR